MSDESQPGWSEDETVGGPDEAEAPAPGESREDHLARRPADDSFVEIFMTMAMGSFGVQVQEGRGNVHFEETPIGLRFTDRDEGGVVRVYAPGSYWKYEIHPVSDGYAEQLREWMKECDHEWLTHPTGPTTYCQHCRLNMAALGDLEVGGIAGLPNAILDDEMIDDQARQFEKIEGKDGAAKLALVHDASGDVCGVPHPMEGTVTCTFPAGHGPIGPDLGSEIVMQHGDPEHEMFWDVEDPSGMGF